GDWSVTGVQTCALPISPRPHPQLTGVCSDDIHRTSPAFSHATLAQFEQPFRVAVRCGRCSAMAAAWEARTDLAKITVPRTVIREIGRASCRERGEISGE